MAPELPPEDKDILAEDPPAAAEAAHGAKRRPEGVAAAAVGTGGRAKRARTSPEGAHKAEPEVAGGGAAPEDSTLARVDEQDAEAPGRAPGEDEKVRCGLAAGVPACTAMVAAAAAAAAATATVTLPPSSVVAKGASTGSKAGSKAELEQYTKWLQAREAVLGSAAAGAGAGKPPKARAFEGTSPAGHPWGRLLSLRNDVAHEVMRGSAYHFFVGVGGNHDLKLPADKARPGTHCRFFRAGDTISIEAMLKGAVSVNGKRLLYKGQQMALKGGDEVSLYLAGAEASKEARTYVLMKLELPPDAEVPRPKPFSRKVPSSKAKQSAEPSASTSRAADPEATLRALKELEELRARDPDKRLASMRVETLVSQLMETAAGAPRKGRPEKSEESGDARARPPPSSEGEAKTAVAAGAGAPRAGSKAGGGGGKAATQAGAADMDLDVEGRTGAAAVEPSDAAATAVAAEKSAAVAATAAIEAAAHGDVVAPLADLATLMFKTAASDAGREAGPGVPNSPVGAFLKGALAETAALAKVKRAAIAGSGEGSASAPAKDASGDADMAEAAAAPDGDDGGAAPDEAAAEDKRAAAKRRAIEATLLEGFVRPEDIKETRDNFPYCHMSESAWMALVHTAFLHIHAEQLGEHVQQLPTAGNRVLLTGPKNSEKYLACVVRALAAHLKANLLFFDCESAQDALPPAALDVPKMIGEEEADAESDEDLPARARVLHFSDLMRVGSRRSGGKDSRASLHKRSSDLLASMGRLMAKGGGTGSVGMMLDEGDRVQFVGGSNGRAIGLLGGGGDLAAAKEVKEAFKEAFGSRRSHSALKERKDKDTAAQAKGPRPGQRGAVALIFEDNPKKVGVRFDSPISGGNDLGGACERDRGFFCNTTDLVPVKGSDGAAGEEAVLEGLFSIVEAKADEPLVLCLQGVDTWCGGDGTDRLLQLRRKLARRHGRVFVVATLAESGDEKSKGSSLAGAGRGGAGSLLEISSFLASEGMGMGERGEGRVARSLGMLFQHKLSIAAPPDGTLAADWAAELEADANARRIDATRAGLRRVMRRYRLECDDLTAIKDTGVPIDTADAERVLSWALSKHVQAEGVDKIKKRLAAADGAGSGGDAGDEVAAGGGKVGEEGEQAAEVSASVGRAAAKGKGKAFDAVGAASSAEAEAAELHATPELPEAARPVLTLPAACISEAVALLKKARAESAGGAKGKLRDVALDNDFEKRLMSDVIAAEDVGVRFDDIGSLDSVKDTLKELVMLPLSRPELFKRGSLTQPCKGVLLFGPPGTGKTLLAKAVATEAGANFISVTMSSIASKWFGEGEKCVKALFTLAAKIAPCIVFIDEVDSMLSRRTQSSNEHEATRKLKNEFMSCWDGMRTKVADRVMVLAASNRPFDLDEAVVRRLPRRLMVPLPDVASREKILRVQLAKEDLAPTKGKDEFDFAELASQTEGYSGSDLKNMCVAAAYRPIRELLKAERESTPPGGKRKCEAETERDGEGEAPTLRALKLCDFLAAKDDVGASVAPDAPGQNELAEWNSLYGEGGSRTKATLTYFL